MARANGRELPLGRAVEEALAVTEVLVAAPPVSPTALDLGLTRRERDVLRLLVEGHTDREIGAALFLSHRTVATHVSNLLAKLGVPSRSAAATSAVRRGLVEERRVGAP
ncbi:MAG: response regulator transcription factor [Chloroflexia bacterium]|nr:response regulator transcription factor [Chloroflexia bacterium]